MKWRYQLLKKIDKIPWYVENYYAQPSPAYWGQIFLFIHSTACLRLKAGRKINNLRLLKMINHFYTIPYSSISASDRISTFSKLKVSNDYCITICRVEAQPFIHSLTWMKVREIKKWIRRFSSIIWCKLKTTRGIESLSIKIIFVCRSMVIATET